VADALGVGQRLAARRRLLVVAFAATVISSASGCSDDGANRYEDTIATTTSIDAGVDVDGAAADLRELLRADPQAIAEDVSALGLTSITADQVGSVAEALCGSAFDPDLTTSWLQGLIVSNVAMVGPANRLLRYAGSPETCGRPPTTAEQDFYQAEVYRVLESGPAVPPGATDVPDRVQATVCDLLRVEGADDAGGVALERLQDLASRGPFDAAELLPYVVEVAGAGCSQWLPTALQALDRYLGT
jgi:hypothetical protein